MRVFIAAIAWAVQDAGALIPRCGVIVREAVRKASVSWRNTSGVSWSRGSSGVFREQ